MERTPRSRLRPSVALLGALALVCASPALPQRAARIAFKTAAPGSRLPSPAQSPEAAQAQAASLREAAQLAHSGQYSQAMAIYRQVYGGNPPPGEPAIAYYETEAATEAGRPHAIAALRSLVARYPAEPRYQVSLGRVLTYNPATRPEGRKLLARHPADPLAIEALRQSLVWDAHNPAAAADIRAYLARHPDEQLALALNIQSATTQATQEAEDAAQSAAQPAADPVVEAQTRRVRTSDEQAAYRALNAHRLEEAERRFKAVLGYSPASAPALAGMGYVRMQQGNFAGAITFLTEARENGASNPNLEAALTTSRFWLTVAAAQAALSAESLASAERLYQNALLLRPDSPDALEGLGSTLIKAHQAQAALEVFNRLIKLTPNAPSAWRGLFLAQYGAGNTSEALLVERRIPPAVHAELMRDPEFLRTLASAEFSAGREADAQRILQDALDLPFPAGGEGLKAETQLQYAALLQQAGRFDQAAGLYRQVLAADNMSAAAWEGLISAQHASGVDADALQSLQAMPAAVYAMAANDPGFQTTVVSIYARQGKLDLAQSLLERAIAAQSSSGQRVSPALDLQLASIDLQRNNAEAAYVIYSRVLRENPSRTEAWEGLLASLHATARDNEALTQARQIPAPVRARLEADPDYLATVSVIYNALGQPTQADLFLARAETIYAARHLTPPAELEIANARLLEKSGNDAALYPRLMLLGGRIDLTLDQRRAIQHEWTVWALRRAAQANAAGDSSRAFAILDATARSFPENAEVLKALGAGYARAGQPGQAVLLFKSQDMTKASTTEYQSAVGAALATHDTRDAEAWLHDALMLYPQDPDILVTAGKFEQMRGKDKRAASYFRAALAASPASSPALQLAPAALPTQPYLPSSAEPGTLAPLLAPAFTIPPPVPYLPSYTGISGTSPIPPGNPPDATAPMPAGRSLTSPTRLRDYVPPQSSKRSPRGNATPAAADSYSRPRLPSLSTIAYARKTNSFPAHQSAAHLVQFTGQSSPPEEVDGTMAPSRNIGQTPLRSVLYPTPVPVKRKRLPAARPKRHPQPHPSSSKSPHSRRGMRPAPPRATAQDLELPTLRQAVVPPSALPPLTYPPVLQPLQPPTNGDLRAGSIPAVTARSLPSSVQITPRVQAQQQLDAIESSYSPWAGTTGTVRFRAGTPGLERLTVVEAPTELSATLANNVRVTVIPHPVFLNSGIIDPTTAPASVVLGTLPANSPAMPAQQFANGLGGEAQLTTQNFGLALGYTPYEFLVHSLTGRARFRPAGGPITLVFQRDAVKETQLSYAGLRNPASPASIWGGVVSTGGGLQFETFMPHMQFSLAAGGAILTGHHVQDNTTVNGSALAVFRLKSFPGYGALRLGASLSAAHFAHNERGLTFGQGGYFSPNTLFLAAVPVTFTGQHGPSLHYRVALSPGIRTAQEDAAPFYPLDPILQSRALASFPSTSTTGATYNIDAQIAYRAAPHWFLGGFLNADNTNLYNTVSTGFFLRYLFRPQISSEDLPTGFFSTEGLRPLRVP